MGKKTTNNWVNLMNTLKWNGIDVWQDMNKITLEENLPKVEQWVRMNLKHLNSHPQEKAALKEFYWPSGEDRNSYTYIRKDRAECALAALYAKEIADDQTEAEV